MDEPHVDTRYPLSGLTARVLAAAHEVHRALGPGFEEVIYQRALEKELPAHAVECAREVWVDVMYKGQKVGSKRVDFVAGDENGDVMIEIKAKVALDEVDFMQMLSYLRASGYKLGLLINFGGKRLEVKRIAN